MPKILESCLFECLSTRIMSGLLDFGAGPEFRRGALYAPGTENLVRKGAYNAPLRQLEGLHGHKQHSTGNPGRSDKRQEH
jgi:hypothetical protein